MGTQQAYNSSVELSEGTKKAAKQAILDAQLCGMEEYIATKLYYAKPMTRQEYNDFKGWLLPSDEDGSDAGYIVQYADGYISWSPVKQFEEASRPTVGMTLGLATEAMYKGYKVARVGWNGKNMFIFLVSGSEFKVNREPLISIFPEGTDIVYRPHIDMRYADGSIGVWNATSSDQLADDWYIVKD